MTARILIVEDEGLVAEEIAMRVQRVGHEIAGVVDNAAAAFESARRSRPDMALVDINLKGALSGIEIAKRFRAEYDVPVIFLTAHADPGTLREATATEPFGYIVKPFEERVLAATLETALRRREAEMRLASMERWLAATMSSIGDAVIATDAEYRISFMNRTAERLCGYAAREAYGLPAGEVFKLRCTANGGLWEAIEHAMRERAAVDLEGCLLETRDGCIPIDKTLAPIQDAAGNVSGIVIVFRDATQRKRYEAQLRELNAQLEEKVRRRTAQLEAANAELASFSYSIAHDLRAPLRAINGFAQRVLHDHSHSLDGEGRRLLQVVTSRAAQMSKMIDDYLQLSGLSRMDLQYKALDVTRLAQEAWSDAIAGVARPPLLQLEPLPATRGDERLMRQVWINLLSNAVKFTRTVDEPRVRVSGWEEGRFVHYRVEDNGVGFDPAQAAKLFRMFERLHTQSEFEGSGIGLCTVQRIVHRHEGDVTIEGAPGRGARVDFWLPKG